MHVRNTRNTCEILVGKQGKRPFNTYRHEEDSIQMEFREIGREDVNWIQLVQVTHLKSAMVLSSGFH
jgi:hypothetical protein